MVDGDKKRWFTLHFIHILIRILTFSDLKMHVQSKKIKKTVADTNGSDVSLCHMIQERDVQQSFLHRHVI